MDKAFESFFKQHFGRQQDIPNPFDKEAFTQFISDQIKNAVPGNTGLNPEQLQHVSNPFPNDQMGKSGKLTSNVYRDSKPVHRHNVFEAHDFVVARISMEHVDLEQEVTILLNSYELFLKEEGKRPSLRIHLPKPINPRKTKVQIRDDILEIQMMKQPPEDLTEFVIRE